MTKIIILKSLTERISDMKNPSWQRDELILALDLYFRMEYNKLNSKHAEVTALSHILNRLPIFSREQRSTTFRNAEGVYMKLGNFVAIDPNDSRKGLPSYGKLDSIVFYEFVNIKETLATIAKGIKEFTSNDFLSNLLETENILEDPDEIYAKEGKVIYRLHKSRERNQRLIKKKKQIIFAKLGKLQCEVCDFDFTLVYGTLGEGFIECHHIKPLSQMKLNDETRLEDLVLVCSNCHRMLHRDLSLTIYDLKEIYKK